MKVEVTTNGKEVAGYFGDDRKPYYFVQHWQLYVNNKFIADTNAPHIAKLYEEIAYNLNEVS